MATVHMKLNEDGECEEITDIEFSKGEEMILAGMAVGSIVLLAVSIVAAVAFLTSL